MLLGAFIPGVAVQPVCIRYHYRHVSSSAFSHARTHTLLFNVLHCVLKKETRFRVCFSFGCLTLEICD